MKVSNDTFVPAALLNNWGSSPSCMKQLPGLIFNIYLLKHDKDQINTLNLKIWWSGTGPMNCLRFGTFYKIFVVPSSREWNLNHLNGFSEYL